METSSPLKKLLRAALNEAAITSVKLPKFNFSDLSDADAGQLKSRIRDFELLRDMGHFDSEKRAQFEAMLRETGQAEHTIQAHANHYSLVSHEKSETNGARFEIEENLNDAGRRVGKTLGDIKQGVANIRKKLDL